MAVSLMRSRRESVAHWLDRIHAPKALRDVAVGMRGFFLADPEELSLLALVDQFAEDGTPGSERMFRIVGGERPSRNQAGAVARTTPAPRDGAPVVWSNHRERVTVTVENGGRQHELLCDYPGVRDPSDDAARRRVRARHARDSAGRDRHAEVRRRHENRPCSSSRATWRKRGKPRAYGTPLPIGAVWDGNEEQTGRQGTGILTLLAGGGASAATRAMLAEGGPSRIRS